MEAEPKRKSVPVDPNVPEQPVELLVQAVRYLVDESDRWEALAVDSSASKTPYAQAVLVAKLSERITAYRARGLHALTRIVDMIVKEHNDQVTAIRAAKEAAEEAKKAEEAGKAAEDERKEPAPDEQGKAG